MKNIEKAMESISGTVFLYCSFKDEKSISFFTNAAEHTGRRLLCRAECQALDPATLASTADKNVSFAAPSMDACTLVRQTDVEHAQREILERAASYESSEG